MASATLLIKGPDGSTREVALEGELTVGRSADNGLVLAEGGVSRRHARFSVDPSGALQLEDVGSAHGTFVNGEKVAGPTVIAIGASVQIGDYSLTVKAPASRAAVAGRPPPGARPPSATPRPPAKSPEGARAALPENAARRPPGPPPRSPGPARQTKMVAAVEKPSALAKRPPSALANAKAPPPGPFPSLKGLDGVWATRRYNLYGLSIVGREPDCELPLDDESISRKHAELELTPEGVIVRDLQSANGTSVNGTQIGAGEEVVLKGGETLQFGVLEFEFDAGDVEALAAPTRRRNRAPSRSRRGPTGVSRAGRAGGATPAGGKNKLLVIAGGAAAMLLVAVGIAVVVPKDDVKPQPNGGTTLAAKVDSKARIQELISQCRSYAMIDFGSEPDWRKADSACNAALDLDPINDEALQLKKKIKFESEAWGFYEKASKAISRKREEEALELFAKIPKESAYFRRAKPSVEEAVAEVKKITLNDCKRYSQNNRWKEALPRCEKYMEFACQNMPREELYPPIGMTLTLNARAKNGEWRPPDANYRRFLQAREKVTPGAAEWRCPDIPLFDRNDVVTDPRQAVEQELAATVKDKELRAALMKYWEGKANEAEFALQNLIGASKKAALHDDARNLLADISTVRQLFGNGSALLKQEFDESLEPFYEALEIDKRLVGEKLSELRPSYFRRTIQSDVARASYESGKVWADRDDFKKACKIWKQGFAMYKADLDLLKALNNACTQRARSILTEAQGCPDLDMVVALAVDGDGLAEQATAKKTELRCQ